MHSISFITFFLSLYLALQINVVVCLHLVYPRSNFNSIHFLKYLMPKIAIETTIQSRASSAGKIKFVILSSDINIEQIVNFNLNWTEHIFNTCELPNKLLKWIGSICIHVRYILLFWFLLCLLLLYFWFFFECV